MSRHLHVDCFAGVAGDMWLGALLDLGAELSPIEAALRSVLPAGTVARLTADRGLRGSVEGIDFRVAWDEPNHGHTHDHGGEHAHHTHTGYREIMAMIEALDAPPRAKQRAGAVTERVARAEARVHGTTMEAVHFHEVGAVDSIVDMLGGALAMEQLDIGSVSCGPVPWPRGWVRCAHGRMPVPAPATAYLMEGMPTVGVDETMEMVTPTGAAWLAATVERWGAMPAMTVEKVGYGLGDKDVPGRPNALRLVMGEATV
ncbi:MAG: LarC family nickel insertion protein [Planctomycetota bacterium]